MSELDPTKRYELQAPLDQPLVLEHRAALVAAKVPRTNWRVTVVDEGGLRTWTAVYEAGATFEPLAPPRA